jgi:hypothetical protein
MRIPLPLKIGALVIATTGFYTYVGQMVPQKEVQPPVDMTISNDLSSGDMARIGRDIMQNKGLCLTCHTIGKTTGPYRFPDLAGVGVRAKTRVAGMSDISRSRSTNRRPSSCLDFRRRCRRSISRRSASPIRKSCA